jgi:hypothetical protein
MYDKLILSADELDVKKRVILLKKEITELPEVNYRLLKVLCYLLYNITKAYQITLMKPSNLAIVFGPVFASPPLNSTSQKGILASLPKLSVAAETLIVSYHQIFEEDMKSDILTFLIKCENSLEKFVNDRKEYIEMEVNEKEEEIKFEKIEEKIEKIEKNEEKVLKIDNEEIKNNDEGIKNIENDDKLKNEEIKNIEKNEEIKNIEEIKNNENNNETKENNE